MTGDGSPAQFRFSGTHLWSVFIFALSGDFIATRTTWCQIDIITAPQ
jgi:hypothetical protein